jgi:hypothetical protein
MKKMKNIKVCCALMGVAALLATTNVQAGVSIGDTGTINVIGTGAPGGGGPLLASASVFGSFTTFCLEVTEHYTGATRYTVNSGAINGGFSGGNPDYLSIGTAFIYNQFTHGAAGYTDGAKVQQAIWWLEGESTTINSFVYGVRNNLIDLANAALGTTDATIVNNASVGAYGVYVLNLIDEQGNLKQDVLAQVPEPSTVVAGALLLLPFGVSTIRILRKNKKA